MNNSRTKIKEIVQKIKLNTSLEQNSKLIKELFSDEENLKCLYNLIGSDNNYEYLDLAKRFYIEIPDNFIIKSLKYKNNTTPANYFLYFSMYAKKLIKDINEVRKHFDKKLIREAENKCLTSWLSRDRHELRKKRVKGYFAPENELEEIYKEMRVDDNQEKKISCNFDFVISFSLKDLNFNCVYSKEEVIVFINLDALIFSREYRNDSEKEEVHRRFEILRDDFYNYNEDNICTEKPSKMLKTPTSASPSENYNDLHEFKRDYNSISIPTDNFFVRLNKIKENNLELISEKLINSLDIKFDNRISNTKELIYTLRENKMKFYCFTRKKICNFMARLMIYNLDFLKKEEIFIQTPSGDSNDFLYLFEGYKKVYFFGLRDRIYDNMIGRISYYNINRSIDLADYIRRKCKSGD
ncbi:hypothetical protein TUBRATIS_21280 [Tubulinosema ratisbonensis]|uniref:Uncharacterized protein n=1 Tax=Tubulinosema ratisbonensis TaxID=291195 RepID=A0A437AJX5_9MICR|nr:hypothetical protein TUBRATIS_21280 [Tubulinosema ratisbonensis]